MSVRALLVTPNLLGADGISCLSRQVLRVLPRPSVVLSLHDQPAADNGLPRTIFAAGGNHSRFLSHAAHLAFESARDTTVVCIHLHLAAVARAVAWRGWRVRPVTNVLCGIEAWVRLRLTERWALDSGRLVAISLHTARRFKAANPEFDQASIDICYPGLPARVPALEPTLAATASEPAALIVGRMSRSEGYKGHDLLIDLWPRVRQRCPGAELWVVGDGDDRARLESLALERGLASAVKFTGRISDGALADLYRRCRLFVMPSRDEGFGLVFLEAMRAGKPCIGARGAAEEIIDHRRTGLIVDPARTDEVLAALTELFSSPTTCDAMGRAGAARFGAAFTDAHFAARFGRVLSNASLEIGHALAG